ncbi:MAG: hypothetical protein ACOYYS_13420 [Chloroflexota bacterium]
MTRTYPRHVSEAQFVLVLKYNYDHIVNGKLLGTVEEENHKSGTILLTVQQNTNDILAYYANLLTQEFDDPFLSPVVPFVNSPYA